MGQRIILFGFLLQRHTILLMRIHCCSRGSVLLMSIGIIRRMFHYQQILSITDYRTQETAFRLMPERSTKELFMPRWMYFLLICTLLAPILELFHVFPLLIFIIAGLGILPLAALIGTSVEGIAEHTGEQIGGLLFATFGNATELIIGILALSQGLVDVVSASIIG